MIDNLCLLIHGFGGNAEETDFLKEYLIQHGVFVKSVMLAGHGGTKKDFGKSTHEEWLRSAEEYFLKAQSKCASITLIGFSMGGLVAANLAGKYDVKKLVFANTPVYYWSPRLILKHSLDDIRNRSFDHIQYYKKGLTQTPLKASMEFLKILKKSKKLFKNVKCPSLILQCKDDETVKSKSAEFIKREINSSTCSLKYYSGGCHQIFSSYCDCREQACQDIFNFLTPHRG